MSEPDGVYLRRVRNPNPMLLELARQAADSIEQLQISAEANNELVQIGALTAAAREYGVPWEYVLDEMERRARARS